MGLLDMLNSEDGLMLGLSLMAAGSPKAQRTGFGEGLLGAFQNVQQAKTAREDRDMKRQMQQAQMADFQAQAQQRAAAAQAAQQQAQRAAAFQQALGGGAIGPQQAMAGGGGPTNANAALLGQRQAPDFRALALQFPEQAKLLEHLAGSQDWGRPEVARTVESMQDGRPVQQQFDKFGRPVGEALPQWKAPVHVDTGGGVQFLDPVSMARLAMLSKTNSPDALLSAATTRRGQDMTDARSREQNSAGQLVETDNGYVRVGKDNRVTPVFAPGGGLQPLRGKGSMTEDQGKATGWLVQAENAYKNMLKSGFDGNGAPKSAAYPDVNDALAKVPALAPLANAMRSPDRQQFIQASSSLSEALLRAATGAGINKDEAAQKVQELTPQFGEDESVTRQKMDAIPLYLESLKVRAGQGAAKAAGIGRPAAGGVKFLGFEN